MVLESSASDLADPDLVGKDANLKSAERIEG